MRGRWGRCSRDSRQNKVLSAALILFAMFDVTEKSIAELQDALTSGRVTSRALVTQYLARIEAYDRGGPHLRAVIAVNPRALEYADALDVERREKGPRGPLHGIPIVIKDNFATVDMPTTGGSIALAGFMTGEDALQVKKLRDAGAIIIAKTNLHELAAGITSVSSLGGQTRNPYDPSRNAGGSSGGTAAAVAASFAAAGMGSDTCGSIRIPAGSNNLFGLRVTPGVSSAQGVIPLSHTQDVAGPLARRVSDLVTMLEATANVRAELDRDAIRGKRIGLLKNLVEEGEVADLNRKALQAMKAAGAEVVEDITIPGLEEPLRDSSVIVHEFKFDLIDFLSHYPNAPVHSLSEILARGDYDKALETIFQSRDKVEARETDAYKKARANRETVRALVVAKMDELKLDALAYPPHQRKPAIAGEPQTGFPNCQLSASSGFPAMSMPAGFTSDGVPIGIELLARPFEETKLLAIAYAYEQAVQPRRAPVTTPKLVDGHAPKPRAFRAGDFDFTFDVTTGRLTYKTKQPLVAVIHRAGDNGTGPVIARLHDASGTVTLNAAESAALADGKLYVQVGPQRATLR